MEEEGVAVAAEDERNVERFGVAEGLLDAGADRVVVVLRLDDGDGECSACSKGCSRRASGLPRA